MHDLALDFTASLRDGAPKRDALAAVGEPDPTAAADAFLRASRHPDLSPLEIWCPALLASARPRHAAQRLLELAEERRGCGAPLDLHAAPSLPHVLGASDFLSRLLVRRPAWVDDLVQPADAAHPEPPRDEAPAACWDAIRDAKYRGLLRIAARDLTGRPFAQSLDELSALADRCLIAAIEVSAEHAGTPVPVLFALGKLGGGELNFSSDVDLLFIYDSAGGAFDPERADAAATLIRHFKKNLEQPSPEGFIYRVDLGLRPEGGLGPLALSGDATLDYYESFGADWERQMLIRLRQLAGSTAIAERFREEIRPFVYRRSIAPEAIHAVREMKDRIERERRAAGRDIDADLKEGPGGIRDVEFLVQSFQLFWGGRRPRLRTGNTLRGLGELARAGLLDEDTGAELSAAYLWLRRAEHCLQIAEEQQTQSYPRDDGAQLCLARRMGYRDAAGEQARARMNADCSRVRSVVRAHFEELLLAEPR